MSLRSYTQYPLVGPPPNAVEQDLPVQPVDNLLLMARVDLHPSLPHLDAEENAEFMA